MNCVTLAADEELEELCFDFGIELDEVVSGRGQTKFHWHSVECVCVSVDIREANDSS